MLLFGGYVPNPKQYPIWISWVQYLSPIRYGLEAFVANEFDHRTYGPGEYNPKYFFGFDTIGLWKSLVALAAISIGLRLLGLLCLKLLVSKF